MALIGLFLLFLVYAFFPYAPNDLCDGLHGQHDFLSKNLGHNGLLVLRLSVPLEHPNEFWVYQLWIVEIAMNFAEEHSTLYVETRTF